MDQRYFEVTCSLCGKPIKWEVYPSSWTIECEARYKSSLSHGIIYGGEVNWFTLGYGSGFDGESWLLAFCDKCLESFKPVKIRNYFPNHNRKYYFSPKIESKTSLPS